MVHRESQPADTLFFPGFHNFCSIKGLIGGQEGIRTADAVVKNSPLKCRLNLAPTRVPSANREFPRQTCVSLAHARRQEKVIGENVECICATPSPPRLVPPFHSSSPSY